MIVWQSMCQGHIVDKTHVASSKSGTNILGTDGGTFVVRHVPEKHHLIEYRCTWKHQSVVTYKMQRLRPHILHIHDLAIRVHDRCAFCRWWFLVTHCSIAFLLYNRYFF